MSKKDNPVQSYIPPLYNRLLSGLSKYTGTSKSQVVSKAVEKYFDEMTPGEREKILNIDKAVK